MTTDEDLGFSDLIRYEVWWNQGNTIDTWEHKANADTNSATIEGLTRAELY